MKMGQLIKYKTFAITIVFILFLTYLNIPNLNANPNITAYNKGPSYTNITPLKKTTFVSFDDDSYLDDYAYLAAVPTTVFEESNRLYSNPLLFYQDKQKGQSNLVLDSAVGIYNFMEDWQKACGGEFDEIIAINVEENKIKQWDAKEFKIINGKNPYKIANNLALHEWSYSDDVVISVIENTNQEKEKKEISGVIKKTFPASSVKKLDTIKINRVNYLEPQFEEINVPDGYTHIKADAWWDSIFGSKGAMISPADPSGDPVVQLYYKKNDKWIQTESSSDSLLGPLGHKYTRSNVYETRSWKVGIVDLPTEKIKTQGQPIKSLFSKTLTYKVDVSLYPGIERIKLPENPKYESKDTKFVLEWDSPDVNLGFSIIGSNGETIYTKVKESSSNSKKICLDSISEIPNDDNYYFSVFSTEDIEKPVEFEIKYSWDQYDSGDFVDSFTSATEGAVLASQLNSPLLYTSKSEVSEETMNVLYRLGVENIYIVDIGNHISKNALDKIREIGKIKSEFKTTKSIIKTIQKMTDQKDVIFTTIKPWNYWSYEDLKLAGEKKGALFLGPAAYIAAHHGSAPFIIEKHPRLSSAAMYHNEFWRRFSSDREHYNPSTSEMISTGVTIYEFLEEYGISKGENLSIITVADQYDIGMTWDRIFPGFANSGRFCGSPVDVSYSISRNMFYPTLVFQNPALNGLVKLVNGSKSIRESNIRKPTLASILNTREPIIDININMYKKTRKEAVEEFSYPVLCSFISYQHKFNQRADTYYGSRYTGADGLTPGFEKTNQIIDQGSMVKLNGDVSNTYPDMSESEIVPFYLKKGGYSCAYSTNLDSVIDNLNNGVILWVHSSHGSTKDGGTSLFWSPEEGFEGRNFKSAKIALFHKKILDLKDTVIGSLLYRYVFNIRKVFDSLEPTASVFDEKNPWRGYEWHYGSTEEPDTMSVDLEGTIPYTNLKIPFLKSTSMDWTSSYKPLRIVLNKIIPFVDPFDVDNLKDGVVGSIAYSKFQYKRYKAIEIEENLDNLHSAGFVTTMCDTANTYLHLMMIRHGSSFQIQNPFSTSQYGAVWQQSIPRDIILGDTIGDAYTKGMRHVGNLYLGDINSVSLEPQLFWDNSQSVVLFGDPDLRVFVPSKKYSNNNYWEEKDVKPLSCKDNLDISGHTPMGATEYPNARQPISIIEKYIVIIVLAILIILAIVSIFFVNKRRKLNEK